MNILGINAYHGDSAACLVQDGKLVSAAEEERFRRIKHWAGLPTESIRYCLAEGNIGIGDVDHIAVNRDPGVNHWKRLKYVLTNRPDPRLILEKIRNLTKASRSNSAIQDAFPGETVRAEMHRIEHHLAHLASAFFVAPFDSAVVASVDGFGDFASAAWGMGDGHDIRIDDRVFFPHSLGVFYSALTQHLGFPHFGDEYKVMGLAPYGRPEFLSEMRKIVLLKADGKFELNLNCFRHHNENVSYNWNDCAPEFGELFAPGLEDVLGPARKQGDELTQRHKDVARSVQAMYEEAFFHLLEHLYEKYQCPDLALAGGCAMNSVANGKLYSQSKFKRAYIPASAGDAGGAIGAAFVVWNRFDRGEDGRFRMDHAYWGPSSAPGEVEALLNSNERQIKEENCSIDRMDNEEALCKRTAEAVAAGKVIGWFQGRMEWGPRALGNRSIVCDPRRADMKDILNLKIKRRESFRPFAPSIMREATAEWFETDDDVNFMMKVFQIREDKRKQVPAVCHVDGSGRLQTVFEKSNRRYYGLIRAFHKLTGVPMVLNTSFNENEPVVCRPGEALDCFLRTKMDVLVLDDYFVERRESA